MKARNFVSVYKILTNRQKKKKKRVRGQKQLWRTYKKKPCPQKLLLFIKKFAWCVTEAYYLLVCTFIYHSSEFARP